MRDEALRSALAAREAAAREAVAANAAVEAADREVEAAARRAEGTRVQPITELPLSELAAATENFAATRRIGEGAFGVVYQAQALPSLREAGEVAIKLLRSSGGAGEQELQTELAVLSSCRHTNLLPLIGCCIDRRGLCLVTPLRRGGNLEDRLLRTPEGLRRLDLLGWSSAPAPLDWRTRLRCVRDATHGLTYLHQLTSSKSHILHRDVKPSNILLDEELRASLTDFGLAKASDSDSSVVASKVSGTPGFVDPFMINSGKHSVMSDGFGIGITLLMSLTGLPGLGILSSCSPMLRAPEDPSAWGEPGLPDGSAGAWPPAALSEALKIVIGLSRGEDPEDRIALPDALERLDALVDAAPTEADDCAAPPEGRMCIICESAPREARFQCGHACCCKSCVVLVQRSDNQCPQCRAPLGDQPEADSGSHIQHADTFVLHAGSSGGGYSSGSSHASSVTSTPALQTANDAGGRGAARGRRTRGRGGRGL